MVPHLRPLSTDRVLITKLADDLEAAHDMDCAEGKCECIGTLGHQIRAAKGRAILEAKNSRNTQE